MENDLKYSVRSREIVDLYGAMKNDRLTLSPYFQRNLVWRDAHKKDFIDTILRGYPFPQIFLARGPIDLETMSASQAVVDGQQRLNAIRDFINGKLEVNSSTFSELSAKAREEFLKYEVPVIDFDLDAGDARLKEVFHRLNRTYYSLSSIEKLASEYSASEFMLVARLLAGEIIGNVSDETAELSDIENDHDGINDTPANIFSRDPGIDAATWDWLIERADGPFATLIRERTIFTSFEFDRKVPLMFTLNLMCTILQGYYERNDRVRKYLDERADEFPEKVEIIETLNSVAQFIADMDLPNTAMWWNKGNFFTVVVELARTPALRDQSPFDAAAKLTAFAQNVPENYALAAREAVGRRAQRELRGLMVRDALA